MKPAISPAKKTRTRVRKSRPVGRPPFAPTAEDRQRVQIFAGFGLKHEEIVFLVINPTTGKPIDEKTLRAHFAYELQVGPPKANSKVIESLFRKATGNGSQSVTAAIWWTKCRMGWRERTEVEVELKSGVLVPPPAVSPEEWIARAAARSAESQEP